MSNITFLGALDDIVTQVPVAHKISDDCSGAEVREALTIEVLAQSFGCSGDKSSKWRAVPGR